MNRTVSHSKSPAQWLWRWLYAGLTCAAAVSAQPAFAQQCTLLPGPLGRVTMVNLGSDGTMLTATATSHTGPFLRVWRRDAQQKWQEIGPGYLGLWPVMAAETDAGLVLVGNFEDWIALSGLFWWDGMGEGWSGLRDFGNDQIRDALLVDGGVLVATTGGVFLVSLSDPAQAELSLDGLRVTSLSRSTHGIVAATDVGVYKTLQERIAWSFVSQPPELVTSVVATSDGGLLAATADGMLAAYDPGGVWVTSGLDGYSVERLAITSEGAILAAASSSSGIGGYVFESMDDGVTWSEGKLLGSEITSMNVTGPDVAASTYAGVYVRSGPGQWTVTGVPNSAPHDALVTDRVLAVLHSGNVSVSEDDGQSWTRLAIAENIRALGRGEDGKLYTAGEGAFHVIRPESYSVTRHDLPSNVARPVGIQGTPAGILIVTAFDGAFLSSDGGETFGSVLSGSRIATVLHAPDGSIYSGGDSVDKSIDGGLTWTSVAPAPLNSGGVMKLAAMAGGGLFAMTSSHVYALSDDGAWTMLLEDGYGLRAIVAGPDNTLYAGNSIGAVFGSADGGLSWTEVGCPREDWLEVTSLAPAPNGGLFVGRLAGGLELVAVPVGVHVHDVPVADASFDVYPNPASSRVTVRWSGDAIVSMHDVTGRRLGSWTLAGDRTTTLDIGPLPAGTYFLRMVSGQTVRTRGLTVQ